ncbi:MAG: 3-isopropylmalate dehydratase small subunit [Pseudomonadota bacterium]
MQKFDQLTGITAPLEIQNVDTDMIIPKQFLRTIKRSGLGIHAFHDMRYDDNGQPNPDFILNQPPYDQASILITGANFGCGSSREHAPWSLLDMGFRCIIAPSFADIFYNNSFKNGILLITLPEDQIASLMEDAKNKGELTVNLNSQTITRPDDSVIEFEVESFRRHCLLNGLDDIGLTMQHREEIDEYEAEISLKRSWI